jgi:hypothetical protein
MQDQLEIINIDNFTSERLFGDKAQNEMMGENVNCLIDTPLNGKFKGSGITKRISWFKILEALNLYNLYCLHFGVNLSQKEHSSEKLLENLTEVNLSLLI